jgi:hypothetical protein
MIAVVLGAMVLESAIFAAIPQTGAGEKLTIVNGYAFVDVSVGGRGPFRMMIDTGASSCSLTPKAARAARLTVDHQVALTTLAKERLVPAASNVPVRVGSVEAGGVEFLAMELDAVRTVDSRADGVLGQSFLSRLPYLIDYRRKFLWLGDEAGRQGGRLGTEIVAERAYGRMVLPVGMGPGSGRWRLALDSGASGLVMRCGGHCPQLWNARRGDAILTNSGACAVRRGIVRRVVVGTTIVRSVEAALLDGQALSFEDGVLPANWFSAVYVDSARNLVRLAK